MNKNFLQDVIPPNNKRSIRDIPLPQHRDRKQAEARPQAKAAAPRPAQAPEARTADPKPAAAEQYSYDRKETVFNPEHLHTDYESDTAASGAMPPRSPSDDREFKTRRKAKSPLKAFIIVVIVAALAAAGFLASRTHATIVIHPKRATYDVDAVIMTDASTTLAVRTQVDKSASVTLKATSEEEVEQQASGRIKISNLYSEKTQELVKNTRFQTPDGLVYRIKNSVTVPGYTVSGGSTVPGTLEVDVYADSAGDEYNIGKTKFSIPGFSGMEQYQKITAESVTDMKGGYVGVKKVVSEEAKEDALEQLEEQVKGQFSPQTIQSESSIVVIDPETVTVGELKDEVQGDSVTLTLPATAVAYSFDKKQLYDFLGQNTATGASAADSFTLNPDGIKFEVDGKEILITGSTLFTWVTDIDAFKQQVAGKKRSEIPAIMDSFASFESADVKVKPFWKSKLPQDTSKITVEVTE